MKKHTTIGSNIVAPWSDGSGPVQHSEAIVQDSESPSKKKVRTYRWVLSVIDQYDVVFVHFTILE